MIASPRMLRKNSIGIETQYGYRSCELYEGDITSPDAAADLLVTSAFAGVYDLVPGTLFAALHQAWALDVGTVAREIDLRVPFSFWISTPLIVGHCRRLLCVELVGGSVDLAQAIANIFVGVAILEARGHGPRTITMPLLGSGNQKLPPETVVAELFPAAEKALRRFPTLERVMFVDKDPVKVAGMDEALNQLLRRSRVLLPRGDLMGNLCVEICADIDAAAASIPHLTWPLFTEMKRILRDEKARSFEVGMLARRLVEIVVDDLLQGRKTLPELASKIEKTVDVGVAPWIRSYMHLLRVLGNESAHEKLSDTRRPLYVAEDDLTVCLLCMQRVLRFWIHSKQATQGGGDSKEAGS